MLAYSVGQQIAIAAFNVAARCALFSLLAGTTDFRSIIRRGQEERGGGRGERRAREGGTGRELG